MDKLDTIIMNAGKHHLKTIGENIREYASLGEQNDALLNKLKESGDGLIDVYTGTLSMREIKQQVWDFMEQNHIHDHASYKQYIETHGNIKREGHYMTMELSDTSVVTLRMGGTKDSFVHIHPGRHSPHTFRIRANTFKTVAYVAFLALCRSISPYNMELINEARRKLGLSVIEEPPVAIFDKLEKLGFPGKPQVATIKTDDVS